MEEKNDTSNASFPNSSSSSSSKPSIEERIEKCLNKFPSPPTHTMVSRQRTLSETKPHLTSEARMFRRFCYERNTPTWEQFQPIREFLLASPPDKIRIVQESALHSLAVDCPYSGQVHQKIFQGAKSIWKGVGGFIAHTGLTPSSSQNNSNSSSSSNTSLDAPIVGDFPDVRLSNYRWTFDTGTNGGLFADDMYRLSVDIRNIGVHDASFHWIHLKNSEAKPRAKFSFSPERGCVPRGETTSIDVRLQLLSKQDELNEFVVLEVPGGSRIACIVRATVQPAVFGVSPHRLKQIQVRLDDAGAHTERRVRQLRRHSVTVPVVLQQLKQTLVGWNGLDEEGIFRLPASSSALADAKKALNAQEYDDHAMGRDVHVVAALIKTWFRELPDPLFTDIPFTALTSCTVEELHTLATQHLSEAYLSLFYWLLSLLSQVVAHQDTNRMTAESCAIVFVPNLVSMEDTSPLELHCYSQHMSKILAQLIVTQDP